MQISKVVTIIFLLIYSLTANCEIIPTYSVKSSTVDKLMKKVDKETLVLFNIDDTLIKPKSAMFACQSPYRNFIDTLIAASKNSPVFNTVILNWFTHRKLSLVEQGLPDFIEGLKKTGAMVIGINQMHYKLQELIKTLEEWRYNELANLGIHFDEKIGSQLKLKLTEDPNKLSIFYKAIIFVQKSSKSEALLNYLKLSNFRPKKIIVFDNDKEQLKQIQYALRKFDIDFFGINYLAITETKVQLNESLIEFQQNTLLNEGKWLEDEEATAIMDSSKEHSVH